jgi:hypothetical protein
VKKVTLFTSFRTDGSSFVTIRSLGDCTSQAEGVECIHELQKVCFVISLVLGTAHFLRAHAVIGRSWGVADGFNL